jgi:hypothetical protein
MNQHTAGWTPDEDAILRHHYPTGGTETTRIALANAGFTRGRKPISARASHLRIPNRHPHTPPAPLEPATGPRPNPNYQYFYPIQPSDALHYHPQLAQALAGTLHDTWVPYINQITLTGETR